MLKQVKVCSFLAIVLCVLTSCASIVGGGGTQVLNFDSNPQGAAIWTGKLKQGEVVDLINTGQVTPFSLTVPRTNAVVILKKDGYKDTNVVMHKTVNGWFFGNIIIGGLIGSSIDVSTGAAQKYDPDNFFLELEAAN